MGTCGDVGAVLDRHNKWSMLISEQEDIEQLVKVLTTELALAKSEREIVKVEVRQVAWEDT